MSNPAVPSASTFRRVGEWLGYLQAAPPSEPSAEPPQTDAASFRSFIGALRSKVTPELASHVAIVAAVVGSVFLAALNGNFLFLLIGGGGMLGEGYLIYKLYQEGQTATPQTPPV